MYVRCYAGCDAYCMLAVLHSPACFSLALHSGCDEVELSTTPSSTAGNCHALQVLLFCTMTRVLDLIQELLEWRGLSGSPDHPAVCRLDGATITADRGDLVTAFNKPGVTSGVK